MLQHIQFHVHENEESQQQIELSLAGEIRENYRLSIGALERYIPSLAELVKNTESTVSTLLCNKLSELNIVNYNNGRVLYGLHPKEAILQHFSDYMAQTPRVALPSGNIGHQNVIVCFGLGLGYHLNQLVESGEFKHVVVYEPNVDHFICSLSSLNWKNILLLAKEKGIALYLQIGADGASLVKDIEELSNHVPLKELWFYKHFHLPIFNSLEEKLFNAEWSELKSWIPSKNDHTFGESYLSPWSMLRDDNQLSERYLNQDTKEKNLVALKKYFPNLYDEFENYCSERWEPSANACGEVFLIHKSTGALFTDTPKKDAETSFSSFSKKPNKDGLLLTYKGKKLKGYLHYQLVEEYGCVIKGVEEEQSELPEKVRSFIQFGLECGYGLDNLMQVHDVEMLFVCEPNRDFFFASLYAIDWAGIIESFDDGKRRLYLNIGDDGSNLTNDLLVQFHSVGPYVLANTFFYQSYVNEHLTDAVAKLREQLLVIIAMGDYFDNAKYGISHTRWALDSEVPFLLADAKQKLPPSVLEVPVFIVGNGPSLDGLMDTLKEEMDNAIVISCGTSLQALHQHGIRPDYHAEIETNRSTFDWLSRVNDSDYLKNITLISCNGIHPDASALFGNTLLAFKQGEASTVAFTELNKAHPFGLLNLSYPTVTNFAADIVTTLGFTQIYLFGTDMGFVSDSYHHSRSSGYYDEKGHEIYDYSANHSMSMVVPGNFKPWVKTKYEFKLSKNVLEQAFSRSKSEVYNLNDGAKILGAKALRQENVLLVSSFEAKENAKASLLANAFSMEHNNWYLTKFERNYSSISLIEELQALNRVLDTTLTSAADVERLITEQRDFIVSSLLRKKSLTFYYLNGTFNYVNSMFSKLLNITDESVVSEAGNALLKLWARYVNDILLIAKHDQYGVDAISSLSGVRRHKVLANLWKESPFDVSFKSQVGKMGSPLVSLATKYPKEDKKSVVINWLNDGEQPSSETALCNISLSLSTCKGLPIEGVTVISPGRFENESEPLQANDLSRLDLALIAIVSELNNVVFLQKYTQHPKMNTGFFTQFEGVDEGKFCYGGPDFIVMSDTPLTQEQLCLNSGDRLVYMPRIKPIDMRRESIDENEYVKRKEAKLAQVTQYQGLVE